MLDGFDISEWLRRAGDLALSREVLELLALQAVLIAGIFALASGIRLATRSLIDRLARRLERYSHGGALASYLCGVATLVYGWLLLVLAKRVAERFGFDLRLIGIAASLTAVWIVLRASALLFRDALFARLVAWIAWIIAALDITGLLAPTTTALDSLALNLGTVRLSLLVVAKAVLIIALLLWAALALARLIGARMQRLDGLSPSMNALTGNLVRIVLVALAILIGLNTVGIDLTAFTVFSGAVGVGLGFGLQKIVSNFVSGIILLAEQSIKPGDVIEVGHTYGAVGSVGARYASVHGRDGKLYLIPNETLITNQVVNWTGAAPMLRLDLTFPVPTDCDLREVRRFAVEAAQRTRRVIASPAPVCHIAEFGDNAINLLLRFWIEDPANGVKNVKGDVYLALWDALREHGIGLPNPLREIQLREPMPRLARREPVRSAAE